MKLSDSDYLDEANAKSLNIKRAILVAIGATIRSILLPYYIILFFFTPDGLIASMIIGMMSNMGGGEGGGESSGEPAGQLISLKGNVEGLLFYIIWIGVISIAIKVSKAYSPKRSGSWRRGVLSVAETAIRIPGLYVVILTGCSVLVLSMAGMMYMEIDLTLYVVVLMGFVVIRLIPELYTLIDESVILLIKKRAGDD